MDIPQDARLPKTSEETEEPAELKVLPTVKFYQKTYALSCGNNDAKAMKLFKEYENRDKLQRLRQELFAISKGRASDDLCTATVGPTRKGVHQTYAKWALMMLNLINSKK